MAADPLFSAAMAFMRGRHERALILNKPYPLRGNGPEIVKTMLGLIAHNFDSGSKQVMLALPELGSLGAGELACIVDAVETVKRDLDGGVETQAGHTHDPHANTLSSKSLTWSSAVVLYTDRTHIPAEDVRAAFAARGYSAMLIDKENFVFHLPPGSRHPELLGSVYIAYGDPNEAFARRLNDYLRQNHVKTWFFPNDALPGASLHRAMHDGVFKHPARVSPTYGRGPAFRLT